MVGQGEGGSRRGPRREGGSERSIRGGEAAYKSKTGDFNGLRRQWAELLGRNSRSKPKKKSLWTVKKRRMKFSEPTPAEPRTVKK